jgi:endo-1,4-beta-D-glucanase Y
MKTPFKLTTPVLQAVLLATAAITLTVFYPAQSQSPAPSTPRPPAVHTQWPLRQLLKKSWQFYKDRFLVDGAHVVSNTYGGTISEGQSYAMLKALWMNEPATFDKVWQWTKRNMKRPHDHLLAWRWGDGEFGTTKGIMQTENATDADQDIAYALLKAGKQWNRPDYSRDGLNIVKDMWRVNVEKLDGRYYLTPGPWPGFKEEYLTINPSYMAPYVYREFAKVDLEHAAGWTQLANEVYDNLEACTNLTAPKLPPNWCAVRWQNVPGQPRIIFSDKQGDGARDFSYDAFRVYWRMAMDAQLSPSPWRERAQAYLKNHPFLLTYWQQHKLMPEGFTASGEPRSTETSGFGMGPLLILNHVRQPERDALLYQQSLGKHYHSDGYWFNDYNDFLHSVIWLHLYALSLDTPS